MAVYTRRRASCTATASTWRTRSAAGSGSPSRCIFFASIPVAYIATAAARWLLWVGAIFVRYPLRLVAGRGDETSS